MIKSKKKTFCLIYFPLLQIMIALNIWSKKYVESSIDLAST